MKNNKKSRNRKVMLLSILSLVAVVGGAVGGTAAWFIANRAAGGTIGNMTAAAVGALAVSTNNGTSWVEDGAIGQIHAGGELTDISGDGVTFYKPIFAATNTDATGGSGATAINTVPGAEGYYLEAHLVFRSIANLVVYLDSSSEIVTADGGNLGQAVRISFANEQGGAPVAYYRDGSTTWNYVNNNTVGENGALPTGTLTTGVMDDDTMTNPTLTSQNTGTYSVPLVTLETEVTDGDDTYYTGHVWIRMWIEGMDAAAVVANIDNTITANLNFFALNPDEEITA